MSITSTARADAAVLHHRLSLPRPATHMDDLPTAAAHRAAPPARVS
jgi:hypothetical protein